MRKIDDNDEPETIDGCSSDPHWKSQRYLSDRLNQISKQTCIPS